MNRVGGPERVIDAVEALAPQGFDDVERVLGYAKREQIVKSYAGKVDGDHESQVAAIEASSRKIRVNTVHPGPVQGDMMRGLEGGMAPANPDAAHEMILQWRRTQRLHSITDDNPQDEPEDDDDGPLAA